MCPRGRELVENEEQDENKMMKSIVVEEQEQEQEQEQDEGSETRFVDLDEDTLHSVLKRVDVFTLGRAACVNKLWCKAAEDERLWEPFVMRILAGIGGLWYFDTYRTEEVSHSLDFGKLSFRLHVRPWLISDIVKPPPDFYSIDFSSMITPWV